MTSACETLRIYKEGTLLDIIKDEDTYHNVRYIADKKKHYIEIFNDDLHYKFKGSDTGTAYYYTYGRNEHFLRITVNKMIFVFSDVSPEFLDDFFNICCLSTTKTYKCSSFNKIPRYASKLEAYKEVL